MLREVGVKKIILILILIILNASLFGGRTRTIYDISEIYDRYDAQDGNIYFGRVSTDNKIVFIERHTIYDSSDSFKLSVSTNSYVDDWANKESLNYYLFNEAFKNRN